ncbi:zinc ABC transporter substrate-binding protein, partial [Vibrio parahaemolyticus]|nr:zinc ABC transporter substrate-binding protein [Vibrio parahaemolyticus]
ELDVGWLPMLPELSSNAGVQIGEKRFFSAAIFVRLRDTQQHVFRCLGEIHADGNAVVKFEANVIFTLSRFVS